MSTSRVEILHPGCLTISPAQCATFLIRLGENCAIVDPGPGLLDAEIHNALAGFGYRPEQVSHILLTHCHADHALGAYRWQQGGALLVGSRHCGNALAEDSEQVWYEYPEYVVPTQLDTVIESDRDLQLGSVCVRAVHTPGHTGGCISYLVEDETGLVLISGDLIDHRAELPWCGSIDFSLNATLRSIKKLREYKPDVAHWGHDAIKEPAMAWLTRAMERGESGSWLPPNLGLPLGERLHAGTPPTPPLEPYTARLKPITVQPSSCPAETE